MNEFSCIIKRGLTDRASRQLLINEEHIKFQSKRLNKNTFSTFLRSEITDYRFGIFWLNLDITFGRQYKIHIRNRDNQILKIAFKSYFGHKVNECHQQYCDILDALWKFHFSKITDDYLQRFENEEEFTLANVHFTKEGITIDEKKGLIPWEEVRTSSHYTYFAIYSEKDASGINRQYNYLNDWNSAVLFSTLRTILKYKNIEVYE